MVSVGTVLRRFSTNTKAETVSHCKDLQELRCQRYEKDTPRQMFVSPNKSHTHTQQPGEVCVCDGAQQQQQQLSVSLQQSAFIKPNKLKHLACDATLRRTNQTTRPNREGRRLRRPSASRERERDTGKKIRTPTGRPIALPVPNFGPDPNMSPAAGRRAVCRYLWPSDDSLTSPVIKIFIYPVTFLHILLEGLALNAHS